VNSSGIHKPRRAFTLIELLVVIAIIAILAALLLPVLSRSKVTAQGVQCTSDHRQLVLAWSLYGHDNDDQLPVLENWVVGDMTDPFDATNASLLLDPKQSALARPPVPGQRLGPAHTSATDRDAQWLQGHCTYLK